MTGPEAAYATAPSVISEIGWTVRGARDCRGGIRVREFWLRKAALLDRIALTDDDPVSGDAATCATEAALRLIEIDRADGPRTADPRGYVRQEYTLWLHHH
ncbi:hypothetical protein [Streptomyces sp. NBC_01264]|uniref:hypothetical protein n=1 Tax=Streptomyces sp. NBC_01264 TaxID=2903804 RepID=UPI00225B2C05|nr:hypothetical protein [Streptomyces sp. NBC_01264]MCX4778685.1 hypothetical protein [Streptomyces sp. NBC_01264]